MRSYFSVSSIVGLTTVTTLLGGIMLLPTLAHAQTFNVTFDEISAGTIDDQYLTPGPNFRGVRFFQGDATNGASTTTTGSAFVGDFGTSLSSPNVLIPGLGSSNDIFVQFYNAAQQRISVSQFGISNDAQGSPANIVLEGFDASGNSLGTTLISGGGASGFFATLNNVNSIFTAKIYAAPGFGDSSDSPGYDDFTYTVAAPAVSASAPEPGSLALLGTVGLGTLPLLGMVGKGIRKRQAH